MVRRSEIITYKNVKKTEMSTEFKKADGYSVVRGDWLDFIVAEKDKER
jgi:hypothetical protein